ncbi:MAG: cache domain-containing protein, partial [Sneathiella sp.]
MFGFNLKISQKLPLVIITSALLMAIILGVTSYYQSSIALHVEVQNKLKTALQGRLTAMEEYLKSIQEDLRITASNPLVATATVEFGMAWQELGQSPSAKLQKLYITDNPFPTGEKEKLDVAKDGSSYSRVHKKYHIWFRKMLQERAYYDIFLFDKEGNLIYTVFKELDYATNLMNGKYRNTDLGKVFRAAKGNPKTDFQTFFDFKPYSPSHGAPASFIASPILKPDGSFIGVLAFQMPIDRLNSIMQDTVGMGRTGESFLVGADFLMRNDSR